MKIQNISKKDQLKAADIDLAIHKITAILKGQCRYFDQGVQR